MKIINRGWMIDLDKIEEGYLYSQYICVAENKSKAKSLLLKEVRYDSMVLKYSRDDEEINFITIPIKRCENADIVLYNGEEVSRSRMLDLIEKEKHNKELDSLLNNKTISHCYIRKRGSYYQDNHSGYTDYKLHAGVYTVEEAVKSGRNCIELDLIPINNKEHNEYLQKHIEKLQNKLLPL